MARLLAQPERPAATTNENRYPSKTHRRLRTSLQFAWSDFGVVWLTNADRPCRSGTRLKNLVTATGSNASRVAGVQSVDAATVPQAEDIDVGALGRALWRAKAWIIGLAALAGLVTFVGLSMVRPLYTSEARILIENDVSPFTRTATDDRDDQRENLNEQAVQSQVQVLTSRDLVLEVVQPLDLTNNPEFAKDAGRRSSRVCSTVSASAGSDKSNRRRPRTPSSNISAVYVLNKSSVIAVDYTSGDRISQPRPPTGSPMSISTGSAPPSSCRPRTPPPGSTSRSRSCARRSPSSETAVEQFRSSRSVRGLQQSHAQRPAALRAEQPAHPRQGAAIRGRGARAADQADARGQRRHRRDARGAEVRADQPPHRAARPGATPNGRAVGDFACPRIRA